MLFRDFLAVWTPTNSTIMAVGLRLLNFRSTVGSQLSVKCYSVQEPIYTKKQEIRIFWKEIKGQISSNQFSSCLSSYSRPFSLYSLSNLSTNVNSVMTWRTNRFCQWLVIDKFSEQFCPVFIRVEILSAVHWRSSRLTKFVGQTICFCYA